MNYNNHAKLTILSDKTQKKTMKILKSLQINVLHINFKCL